MKITLESRQKLAEVVKKARGSKSQRAYGRMLGVSGTTVQGWENLESFPEMDNLAQIAESAGYTLQELLDYIEGKSDQRSISSVNQIVKQLNLMPLHQVAMVVQAGVDRLAEAATSLSRSA